MCFLYVVVVSSKKGGVRPRGVSEMEQGQGHEKVRHRSAVLQLQMALSLVLALTLVHFANPPSA